MTAHYDIRDFPQVEAETTASFDRQTWLERMADAVDLPNRQQMIRLLSDYAGLSRRLNVHLDYENIYFSLKEMGLYPYAEAVVDAIKDALQQSGKIISITAYADWGQLRRERRCDIQRKLVQRGVKTCYTLTGQNSADIELVNGLRDSLEEDRDKFDTYVIGTGDGDFRSLADAIKRRGKGVIILACTNSLSQTLRQSADEVIYLDNYIKHSTQHSRKEQSHQRMSVQKYLAMAG